MSRDKLACKNLQNMVRKRSKDVNFLGGINLTNNLNTKVQLTSPLSNVSLQNKAVLNVSKCVSWWRFSAALAFTSQYPTAYVSCQVGSSAMIASRLVSN
ncbi:unnamed protein product [Mucor hiemalis]